MVRPGRPEAPLTLNGQDPSIQPIEVDLTEPLVLTGIDPGELVSVAFTQLGAPVGTTEVATAAPDGSVVLEPGFIGRVTSGAVEATATSRADPTAQSVDQFTVEVTANNPWYLTAAGIISLILVLFGAAGIESSLRAFRRGRGRAATYVGLLVTGALFGGAAGIACTIVFGTARGPLGIAGPAALAAAGALVLGLAARANRTRRRAARQELRHTAIKALAKR